MACLIGCKSKPIVVSGEIFIVTQGAGNYKMGLVEVKAYNAQDFRAHIDTLSGRLYHQKNTTDSLITEVSIYLPTIVERFIEARGLRNTTRSSTYSYDTYRSASKYYESATLLLNETYEKIQDVRETYPRYIIESILEDAPKPTANSKTNADGVFSMSLQPNVEYVFVAYGNRRVWGKTEEYAWLITRIIDTKTNEPITFSNDNLFGFTPNKVDIFNLKRFDLLGETVGERLAKTEID